MTKFLRCLLSAVHFVEIDFARVNLFDLGPGIRHLLAVAAPWGKELDEDGLVSNEFASLLI